jgi:murein DD-endopeptidase MepM/ murein hydrolase activator NlpD
MIFKFPLDYIGITQTFSSSHRGVDLGWHNYQGEPVYASADGVVYSTKDYDTSGTSWGNFVKLDHGNGWYTLYAHLRDGLQVSNGQQVKQGDLLGYMGNTGHSYGTHLHYEVYQGGADTSCRIDPLTVTYVFNGQQVSDGSKNMVLYYNQDLPEVGTWFIVNDPEGLWLLDENGNHIRAYEQGTDIIYQGLGYYRYGYQYYYVKVNGDAALGYMAKDYLSLKYPEPEPQPTPTPEPEPMPEPIDDKDKQIEELNNKIALLEKQRDELIHALTYSKFEYKIDEPNYYKISMYQDETLCIKFPKDTEFEMQLDKGSVVKVK